MANILFLNGRYLTDGCQKAEPHLRLTHKAGVITSLDFLSEIPSDTTSYDQVIDLSGDYLAPGMIDIQLNGGYTKYFSLTPDLDTLAEMTDASLEFGTPFFYATLISSPLDVVHRAIDVVRTAMQSNPYLLGMHLEGPFLNPQRKGAHNASLLHSPTDAELEEVLERGKGVIKLITIAPEMLTHAQIELIQRSGIQVSFGHSEATYEEAMELFDRGVNIVTHLYNAMSAFTHRAPGLTGAALLHPDVYTPLILDGRHCHWAAARLAYRLKGDKLILLTDAAVLGRRMQEMAWEGLHAILTPDGFYVNPEGNLAGAAISMGEAVEHACKHLGVSPAEAMDMASGRVAKAIGVWGEKLGHIAVGYRAVFTRWSTEGQFTTLDVTNSERKA